MVLPVKYREGEAQNTNFSFSEVVSGRGIIQLYLVNFVNAIYQLTETVIYAENNGTRKIATESFDLDFDIDIIKPMTIEGLGSFTFGAAIKNQSGGANAADVDFTIKIVKVDAASAETVLFTSATITFDWDLAGSAEKSERFSVSLDIPNTILKKGEKLRINVSSDALPTNSHVFFLHDPKNRTSNLKFTGTGSVPSDVSASGTESYALLPVKIPS